LEEAVCGHGGDSRVVTVAVVETRYAVRGWGVGELWSADGVVLAHEFRFGPASDMVTDSGSDPVTRRLIRSVHALLGGVDVSFEDVAIDLDWATPLQRALADALRAVPRGEIVSYGELAALAGRPRRSRRRRLLRSESVRVHRAVPSSRLGDRHRRVRRRRRRREAAIARARRSRAVITSEDVREELAAIAPQRECDRRAELSALFHAAGSLHLRGAGDWGLH
jgi:alkylated DNA nucleotide flippase Atl1